LDRPLGIRNGEVIVATTDVSERAERVGPRSLRPQSDCLRKVFNRSVELAFLRIDDAAVRKTKAFLGASATAAFASLRARSISPLLLYASARLASGVPFCGASRIA
jgi:hypothetical protein